MSDPVIDTVARWLPTVGTGVVAWLLWSLRVPIRIAMLQVRHEQDRARHGQDRDLSLQRRADDARLAEMGQQVAVIEERLAGMPNAEDVITLGRDVERLGGQIRTLEARIDGLNTLVTRIERTMSRMEQHLLEQGRT